MKRETKARLKLEGMLDRLDDNLLLASDKDFINKYVMTCYVFHRTGNYRTYETYMARLLEYPSRSLESESNIKELKGGRT